MTRFPFLFGLLCVSLLVVPPAGGRPVQDGAFDPPSGFGLTLEEVDAAAMAEKSRADHLSREQDDRSFPEPDRTHVPASRPLQPSRPASESALPLIERDPPPAPLFTGPVPRDPALAQDATLNDLCCVGRTAVAVGDRGVVCVSADAGRSWVTGFLPEDCSLRSVCFVTDRIGWVAGVLARPGVQDTSAVLFHTRDGGKTWSRLTFPLAVPAPGAIPLAKLPGLVHVQFFGLDEAVAVSLPDTRGAAVFRSADGGATWKPVSLGAQGSEWLAARFRSPEEGLLVGTRQSYAAVMSGQGILINEPQPALRTFRGVTTDHGGQSWLVGDGALMLTSRNAGVSWEPPAGSLPDRIRDVLDLETVVCRGETVLMAGTPASVLLRSDNAGVDWSIQTLPCSGRIRRLCWSGSSQVLAAGSFGQILRSEDAGRSWQTVRSAGLHAGVLSFTSDLAKPGASLLGEVTADQGVRSVLFQLSEALPQESPAGSTASAARSVRRHLALTELGVSDCRADWMFPRSAPEVERLAGLLLKEWNQQSDGRAEERLPRRLAREIRIWKPTILVIEPATTPDGIAALIRNALPAALSIAATRDPSGELETVGLEPWTVARVVERQPESGVSTLKFDPAALLRSLGTTTSLLTRNWPRDVTHGPPSATGTAMYRIVHEAEGHSAGDALLMNLRPELPEQARRPSRQSAITNLQQIRGMLLQAQTELAAHAVQARSNSTANAIIAQLPELAAGLPDTLALQQLMELADRHEQSGNLEAWLAIQQELIRRYPDSPAGQSAAGTLFFYYSSAETRHARLRRIAEHTGTLRAPENGEIPASHGDSQPGVLQPRWQTPQTPAPGAAAGNSLAALHERWDAQAMTAWKILTAGRAGLQAAELDPLIRIRHAANLRRMKRPGDSHSELAGLAQLPGLPGLFAQSELQAVHQAAEPALPILNLPRSGNAPFLDARLTDPIWEDSQELFLTAPGRTAFSGTALTVHQAPDLTNTDTLVLLGWDDEYLYLAARLQLPAEGSRRIQLASSRRHDDPHGELDRLELELDTDRDLTTSWQLTIDESGRVSERCWRFENWNPEWFVAVDRDDQSWRIEAAVPLRELSATGASPGDLWSFRLRRVRPGAFRRELNAGAPATQGTALLRFIRPRRTSSKSPGR